MKKLQKVPRFSSVYHLKTVFTPSAPGPGMIQKWVWVIVATSVLKFNLYLKSFVSWYISDIKIATHLYLKCISGDLASAIFGAASISTVLFDVNSTINEYRIITALGIDRALRRMIEFVDVDIMQLSEPTHLFVRETTRIQNAAYSKALKYNIVCILNLLNLWITVTIMSAILVIMLLKIDLLSRQHRYILQSRSCLQID